MNNDRIIRATAGDGYIKMAVITAKDTVQRGCSVHGCSPTASAALGRLLCAASLMGNMMKEENATLTLRVNGGGIAGSVVAVFLMWKAVGQSFSLPFQLPWVQMLIGVAAVFLLVALTMAYSVHKIRNDSIVEDLRLE